MFPNGPRDLAVGGAAAFSAACLLLPCADAHAQALGPGAGRALPPIGGPPPPGRDWSVALGAAALVLPEFPGAEAYRFLPVPEVDVRYRDLAFLSFRDGAGINALRLDGLTAGPVARFRFPRDQDTNIKALRGVGDVDGTVELGGFVRWDFRPFRVTAEVRQGVNGGGHEGLVADFGADWSGRLGPGLAFSVGPRLTLGDGRFIRAYYGVDEAQAARSGYRRYRPGGGVESVGVAGSLRYAFAEGWTAAAFADVRRLVGDAADAPLVRGRFGSEAQAFVGLSLSYRFAF